MGFASNQQEIQSALQPTVPPEVLYQSLGGSKPEKFDFTHLDQYMRSIDIGAFLIIFSLSPSV